MTAVKATPTTPPPRLPVRDKAVAGDRGWGGVSPMLTRLAAEEATGVLVRERGSLHLVDGGVVHAESPSAPGLDLLLTAHGTLGAEAWEAAARATDDRHATTRLLLDGGLLSPGALELCHLGALYDAAYFVLAPSSTPGRFRYGVTHPLGGAAGSGGRTGAGDAAPPGSAAPRVAGRGDGRRAAGAGRPRRARAGHAPAGRGTGPGGRRPYGDGHRAGPGPAGVSHAAGRPAAGVGGARLAPVSRARRGDRTGPAPGATPVPDVVDPDITLLKRLRDALEAL